MGFFDLNIPHLDSSLSDKTAFKARRTKLVIKAMELGYTGIAYNRTIKGVMSDIDRCAISLLTLSSLLKLAPSLSSSVGLHRDFLGVPRASPFRQYTRLTVCVESQSQAQALNSGNPILKTYDLVAVRALNQTVFDQACEKLEVCRLELFIGFSVSVAWKVEETGKENYSFDKNLPSKFGFAPFSLQGKHCMVWDYCWEYLFVVVFVG